MTDKPMTAGEVREKLKGCSDDTLVLIPAWNGWYTGVTQIYELNCRLADNLKESKFYEALYNGKYKAIVLNT